MVLGKCLEVLENTVNLEVRKRRTLPELLSPNDEPPTKRAI